MNINDKIQRLKWAYTARKLFEKHRSSKVLKYHTDYSDFMYCKRIPKTAFEMKIAMKKGKSPRKVG